MERLAAYWGEVLGGAPAYSQASEGSQSALLEMHAHNGPMGDLGDRFAACFAAAMDDAGLPADADFRAAMNAYMRWAVDDVLVYAPFDAEVPPARGSRAGAGTGSSARERERSFPLARRAEETLHRAQRDQSSPRRSSGQLFRLRLNN